MALNTKHSYANRLYAHLTDAVTSGAISLSFYPEEITNLLAGWQPSSWLYLCIMDSEGNLEIVKMTALSGSTLTVERGQGGTTARAWNAGALVACRAVAEYLTRYLQKGVFRSGAYNPNGVLTGEYTGEKFYQTGPAAEQRRWWINTTGSKWRLLTGEPYLYEYQDADGYWIDPLRIIGETSDGLVANVSVGDWATCRSAASGSSVNSSNATYTPGVTAMIGFSIYRSFFFFDLSAYAGLVATAARLCVYAADDSSEAINSKDMTIQEGTQADTLTVADFDAFSGGSLGTISIPTWDPMQYNLVEGELNQDGLTYLNFILLAGGTAKFCLRETDHDFANVQPGLSPNYGYFGMCYANHATKKPYLEIEL